MNLRTGEHITVAEMRNKYADGCPVLLFGVDGLPNNCKGVVDFIDDTGRIFIETAKGLKNVVLAPSDEGVCFVKDCVNFPNVVSNKVCAIEEIEFDDVFGAFLPYDHSRPYDICGVAANAWLYDSFIASIPEFKHCLDDSNDHFVNAFAVWDLVRDVVKVVAFLNDDKMNSDAKEFVLYNNDREFIINEFNKFFIENDGFPTKVCFELLAYEDKILDYLDKHKMSAKDVLDNPMFVDRINAVCDVRDLDKTRNVLRSIVNKSKTVKGLDTVLADAKEKSNLTDSGKECMDKEDVGYGK